MVWSWPIRYWLAPKVYQTKKKRKELGSDILFSLWLRKSRKIGKQKRKCNYSSGASPFHRLQRAKRVPFPTFYFVFFIDRHIFKFFAHFIICSMSLYHISIRLYTHTYICYVYFLNLNRDGGHPWIIWVLSVLSWPNFTSKHIKWRGPDTGL